MKPTKKEPFLSNYPRVQAGLNVLLGLAFCFGSYYLWLELSKWEVEGGVKYGSRLFFFLYDTLGKEVTCILIGLCSLIFFFNAYKILKKVKANRS